MAEEESTEAELVREHASRSPKEWGLRLLLMLIGLIIAHFGVTLFLLPGLGTNPFTIFAEGCAAIFGVSIGTTYIVIMCLLMAVMMLTTRGYVLPGTVVCTFFGGPIIDLFYWILEGCVTPQSSMAARLASVVAGCVVLAAGAALVIKSDAGTGTNDLVAVILTDKLKRFQFRTVRIACDLFLAGFGFLLGGVLGIGSVIAALLVGPVAQFFFPMWEKVVAASVAALRKN